jgi:NAD(P)-dependent dehydrogenase (short-subunit alcohol dehydrogenase family)
MKDKIVLVTGASGGLGSYITQAFLDAGATVVGVSRKIQQADFNSPAFTALAAEISTAAGVESVLGRFGRLDVVVHTVGGFAGGPSVAETDDSTFQRMFDVNLKSTFYLLRAVLPVMRKTRNGRIIAIGSRGAGSGRGSRSIQRLEGSHGRPDKDSSSGKQGRWNHCQRDPARYDGHAGEPQGDAECGRQQMGPASQCRTPGHLARRRCRQRRQRGSHSGLWQ